MLIRTLALAALLGPAAAAQPLTLTPRADADAALPPSVRTFEVTREGSALRAVLVRADLDADDWALEAVLSDAGSETVRSFADDEGVFVAVNGGYFGSGQSFSLVLNDGVTLTPNIRALTRSGTPFYPTRGAFGVDAARSADVAWVYTPSGDVTYAYPVPSPNAPGAPQPQPTAAGGTVWDVETAIGGGPVLVQDGRADLTWTEEVFFGGSGVDTTSARARTAVGYTAGGEVLIVAVAESNGLTLPALAALLVELGAVEAVNLDGGGSTALWAGGVGLVTSPRPVVSALRVRRPGGAAPRDSLVFDTGDAGYREIGDWFESANTPFYGSTPSRLNETGRGDDRAVFVFDTPDPQTSYRVEAWWTPAANRAVDTPFTVYHEGEGTTFRVDQSDAAAVGQWVALGVVDRLAPGDSLVVTDDATGATSPAFVSVDAVRLVNIGIAATGDGPDGGPALRVGPNPTAGRLAVAVDVRQPGRVAIDVVDALGRVVARSDAVGAGRVTVELDLGRLAPGAYVVRARTAGGVRAAPVTVVR